MKNFININATEEEQVEQIKSWIKENYLTLIIGIVIGLGLIFGLDYYKNYQLQQNLTARTNYLQLQNDITSKINLNNHNAYNSQAQMLIAKNNVNNKEYDKAIGNLSLAQNDILKEVENLKKARIYVQQSKLEKALELAQKSKLTSLAKHLIADIYALMGKIELAKETYQTAKELTKNEQIQTLIEIKINNLN